MVDAQNHRRKNFAKEIRRAKRNVVKLSSGDECGMMEYTEMAIATIIHLFEDGLLLHSMIKIHLNLMKPMKNLSQFFKNKNKTTSTLFK